MFTIYLYLAPILAIILIGLNYLISNENPYVEKMVLSNVVSHHTNKQDQLLM